MAIDGKTAVPSAAANGKHGHTLISDAKFRQLYGLALRLRRTPGNANGSGRRQRGSATGEAALAGVTADLEAGDVLIAELEPCVAEVLRSELPGVTDGAASSPITETFGERVIQALSAAAADRLRGNGRVTVIVAPRGAADPRTGKVMGQAHAMAASARLPVLFVEDESATGAAAGSAAAAKKKAASTITDGGADGVWMAAIPVDAEDVVAMYRVAHESMTRAREGTGPTRIVCARWMAETTGRKRPRDGQAIANLENWLESRGLPAQQWRHEIGHELEKRG